MSSEEICFGFGLGLQTFVFISRNPLFPRRETSGAGGVLEFVWEFPASAGSSWPMLKFVWALHLWTPLFFILRKAAMSRNVVVGWRRFE